ncbi:hypothetical protein F0562_022284 [Nyssa sinensis]|uniref:Uncharacterized protein n=1 Tax=Nyssa sinensis TaxID=561372 RepID=A0A5J5BR89_9ASTE|nr:hypothetical protein F0562_022284 [Nyssa sinensis]
MDPGGGATRLRHRKTPSSDRFLGVFTHSKPETAVSSAGDELTEDDVFWTGDFAEYNHSSNSPSPSPSPSISVNRDHHYHAKGFGGPEYFGILAALPLTESEQNFQTRSVFNHRASVSSSAASSSTMIPTVLKKPPLDRQSSVKYHQSAPVNVPMLSDAMRRNRAIHEFDDIDVDDVEADGEMLPPHEIVASKESPMVAFSVLEGVGRTLKGRDLRQVRNAVWRKTGIVEACKELRPLLFQSMDHLKDLLLLDIALDTIVRTTIEKGCKKLNSAKLENEKMENIGSEIEA